MCVLLQPGLISQSDKVAAAERLRGGKEVYVSVHTVNMAHRGSTE